MADEPKMGRPTLRRPVGIEGVLERSLRAGVGFAGAAEIAGIAGSTLSLWRKEDEALNRTLCSARWDLAERAWKGLGRVVDREDPKSDSAVVAAAKFIIEHAYPIREEPSEDQLADLAARLLAYNDAMRATVPEPPVANGSAP